MSESAQVQSLEAIESVKNSLASFSDDIQQAVTILSAEIRRVIEWIEHDRPRYWKQQIHAAMDALDQAQSELHRCLMFPIADDRPSCYEERKALKRAEARLAYCEEKAEQVRHWSRTINCEYFEYEARLNTLSRTAEIDAAKSVAILSKLIQRLEEYQTIGPKTGMSAYEGSKLVEELFSQPVEEEESQETSDGGQESEGRKQAKGNKS